MRRDLNEVQIELTRLAERFARVHYPDLRTVGPDEANPWRPDPVVDTRIR